MFKISVKNLLANKRRFIGTCSAVLLGVAFLAGTLVLGDTMRHGFQQAFTTANAGTDVVVRSASTIGTGDDQQRGTLSPQVEQTIHSVPGVRGVVPQITGIAQLVGANGKALGGNGPPTLAGNWIADRALNPFHLVSGHAPRAPGEIVIDQGSATKGKLRVGSHTVVQTPTPVHVTVVGIARFGNSASLGGATSTLFTTERAQQLFAGGDRINAFLVTAAPGVSASTLAHRLGQVLPAGVQAKTGAEVTAEQVDSVSSGFLNFFEGFLLVFSGVAMLVATFSIHNTFAVVLAQRTRESALLRAIGATRRQVLSAAAIETLLVGIVATAAGLAAGMGLAAGLLALLRGAGLGVPTSGLVVSATSLWVAALVGVVVTLLAGFAPAWGASRVPPLAALRAVALERVTAPRRRAVIGIVLGGAGLALTVGPAAGWWTESLTLIGVGAAVTLIGVVALGPLVARRIAGVVGRPIARWRGITGALARENAVRNPRRTAGTATALMVGIGVVTLFMVFGASLDASVADTVARSIHADVIVESQGFSGSGLSATMAPQLARIPGVAHAVSLGDGEVSIGGKEQEIDFGEPRQVPYVLDVGVARGTIAGLHDDEIALSTKYATDHHLGMGSTVPMRFVDGTRSTFTVAGLYRNDDFADAVIMPTAAYAPHTTRAVIDFVMIKAAPGADTTALRHAVSDQVRSIGSPKVLTKAGFISEASGRIGTILSIVYVMLALSILIALMGIANTLSLSIHERVRELGLLRAVGQLRPQTRAMIRWEAVIISLFGTLAGVGVGTLLGWSLVKGAAASDGVGVFAAPISRIVVILVLGALVGIVAGWRPARRAARVDVLEAIATN